MFLCPDRDPYHKIWMVPTLSLARERIARRKRTSPCETSVLNLGHTPRIFGISADQDTEGSDLAHLPDRHPRKFLPSHLQAMALFSRAVGPEIRDKFVQRFELEMRGGKEMDDILICDTPIRWLRNAYRCPDPTPINGASDMFPNSGDVSAFLNEFFVMDVVLNRSVFPAMVVHQSNGKKGKTAVDADVVVMPLAYDGNDLDDVNDYKYRTMIMFLPQCGVFYCARERRHGDVGLLNSLIPLDMSWLRLQRSDTADNDGSASYSFGRGGYVKRFWRECSPLSACTGVGRTVSAWRISMGRMGGGGTPRLLWRASQCHDRDGPIMAPDVFFGEDTSAWPHEYRMLEYNERLATANSARVHGRHYANGCHHYKIPDTCWVINPENAVYHCLDLLVDVATVGLCAHRQSVVMIRNFLEMETKSDGDDDLDEGIHNCGDREDVLAKITEHNALLCRQAPTGGARARGDDVGTMHTIGTRVELDNVNVSPYKANALVSKQCLQNLVVGLWKVGSYCFPHVLSVIRDVEADSGIIALSPEGGVVASSPINGNITQGCRVGNTIDMSVNLGNSSHYDVHDASQGFSVWTEEIRGLGSNWFFVMPNLHGNGPDGKAFYGIAIKLGYGIAISWDGRVIRHATSISHPDGPNGMRVGNVGYGGRNHLFGTFTAAKERVIKVGRSLSAAATATATGDNDGRESGNHCGGSTLRQAKNPKRHRRRGRHTVKTMSHRRRGQHPGQSDV